MHYIVMDLEWNQPMSFHTPAFKEIGDQLLFEIIQIGAVKLNGRFRIVDEIDVLISPTYYKRLHPYVRRMTHLTNDDLKGAPAFAEGMARFQSFCGEDAVLLTWGADDVSVLQQNVDCFAVDCKLPKTYNIQRYYADAFKLGNSQKALKTAMEQLKIQEEEDRAFHHALHDAYYTARVLQKMPTPKKVLNFEQQPRKLSHAASRRRFRITHTVPSVAEGLKHKDVFAALLPNLQACRRADYRAYPTGARPLYRPVQMQKARAVAGARALRAAEWQAKGYERQRFPRQPPDPRLCAYQSAAAPVPPEERLCLPRPRRFEPGPFLQHAIRRSLIGAAK